MRADLLATFDGLDPIVYVDPEPGGTPNPWRTYRYALERFPDDASHLVLMQDDAVPVDGFRGAVERAVVARPDVPICLFVSHQASRNVRRMMDACQADAPFFVCDPSQWVPVVALVWPKDHAVAFLEWAETAGYRSARRRADDAIVGDWMKHSGTQVVGTVPSLVEHPDEEESLIGLKHRIPRRAVCLADHGDDYRP